MLITIHQIGRYLELSFFVLRVKKRLLRRVCDIAMLFFFFNSLHLKIDILKNIPVDTKQRTIYHGIVQRLSNNISMRVAFNGRGRLLWLPSRVGYIVFLEWKKNSQNSYSAFCCNKSESINNQTSERGNRDKRRRSAPTLNHSDAILPGDFLPVSRATQSSDFTHRPDAADQK